MRPAKKHPKLIFSPLKTVVVVRQKNFLGVFVVIHPKLSYFTLNNLI